MMHHLVSRVCRATCLLLAVVTLEQGHLWIAAEPQVAASQGTTR